MNIRIKTLDSGGTDKNPMLIIESEAADRNGSFYYCSAIENWEGIQVNNEELKPAILDICRAIDDQVRKLHKLVNE